MDTLERKGFKTVIRCSDYTRISPVNCFTCGVSGGMLSLIREYSYYALQEGLVTQDQIQSLREYVLLAEEDMDVDTDLIVVDQVVIPKWVEEHLGQYHPYLAARE